MADTEKIVSEVADRVRELVSDAEQRATEIVREAEEEAKRIRARAETEGHERLAEVRRALEELQGKLGVEGGGAEGGGASTGRSEVDPGPVRVPEPTPDPVPEPSPEPVPEPSPEPVPEPTPERIPEPTPPPDEGTPPTPAPTEQIAADAGNGTKSSDTASARLVAMNMALDGASREEIDTTLAADYDLDNRAKLVDEVLARAGR
jgi:outer membrane biosynthesis protein TonB